MFKKRKKPTLSQAAPKVRRRTKFYYVNWHRVAWFACLAALVFTGNWLATDSWLKTQQTTLEANLTANSRPTPRRPRYQILRKRYNVLVTEKHPDTPPPNALSGTLPIITQVHTTDPVIFVTIDDGVFKEPKAAEFMSNLRLPFTMFLTTNDIKDNYTFFGQLKESGMSIENHTVTHPHLKTLDINQQRANICGSSDDVFAHYGRRPVMLRPPYGEYNDATLQAAKDCQLKAIVLWDVVVDKGQLQYQTPNTQLNPGDIVLLHFRPELMQDIQTVLDQAKKQHLAIADLEDWL
jgi:peptidoglycan/xylan/chitin deacetylase (PgdA/CDA1 family)